MRSTSLFCSFFIASYFLFVLDLSAINIPTNGNERAKTSSDSTQLCVLYRFSQKANKKGEQIVLTDTMALVVNAYHSMYYDWNKQRNDSIDRVRVNSLITNVKSMTVHQDETMLQDLLERMHEPSFISDESKGESAYIYKNKPQRKITTIDEGPSQGGKSYLQVKEVIQPQNWTIQEDTLSILGYECQKATTSFRGRNYSVWFTLSIPISDGPWKFYGLPGIILKVEDDKGIFLFEAIGISRCANKEIKFPTDRKMEVCTLKQLNAYRRNRFKDLKYGFCKNGNLQVFKSKNPIKFNSLEIR